MDAANGVAAEKLVLLNALLGGLLVVKVYNDGSQGKLNYMVRGFSSNQAIESLLGILIWCGLACYTCTCVYAVNCFH